MHRGEETLNIVAIVLIHGNVARRLFFSFFRGVPDIKMSVCWTSTRTSLSSGAQNGVITADPPLQRSEGSIYLESGVARAAPTAHFLR